MVHPRYPISMEPLKSCKRSTENTMKGRIFRPFLCGLLVVIPVTGFCFDNPKLAIRFESVSYNESTSLRSITGEWDDKVTSGDDTLSVTRFYVGYEDDSISIQYLRRYDILYEYANDTARLIYQTENRLPLTPGDEYQLYIRSKSSVSRGIRLGYIKQLGQDFNIAAFFSLLSPTDLEDGVLNGSAIATTSNDYDFNISSDVFYRDDPLFDRDSESLSGSGYALDLNFDYTMSEQWYVKLELLDVLGELSFNNAPYTTADATSDVKSFDEEGYVIYNPVVTGVEGNKDFSYEFDMESHLTILYTLSSQYRFSLLHHDYRNIAYQELQFIQSFTRNMISWHLIPELKAAGISYHSPNFMIGLVADDLDFDKTKYLAVYSRIFIPF